MPSQWTKLEIPMTAGLNEKSKPEAIPNGQFTQLHNVVQTRDGAYTKRAGHTLLSKGIYYYGGAISAGAKLLGFRDSPCMIDGEMLYSYSNTAGLSEIVSRVPPMSPSREAIAGLALTPQGIDCIYVNGYFITAWSIVADATGNALGYVHVTDAATGKAFALNAYNQFISNTNPVFRLCAVGNIAFLIYGSSATANTLKYYRLDVTSQATLAAGWLGGTLPNATDVYGGQWIFDAVGGTSRLYVAYADNNTGDGHRVTVRAYDTTPAQTSTTTYAMSGNPSSAVSLGGSQTDRVWLAQSDSVNMSVVGLDPSNVAAAPLSSALTVIADAAYELSVFGKGGGTGHLLSGGTNSAMSWRNFSTVAGAVSVAGTTTMSRFRAYPSSRQFQMSGRIYAHAMLVDTGTTKASQGMTALVDVTDSGNYVGNICATPAARITVAPAKLIQNAGAVQQSGLPGVATITNTMVALPIVVKKSTSAGQARAGSASSLDLVTYDFADANRWQVASVGESLLFGGGSAWCFDGRQANEVGFWGAPDMTCATAAFGGGLTVGATYQYVPIYEAVTAAGNVDWSAPGTPVTVGPIIGGNTQVNATVSTLQISNRLTGASTVRIVLYRRVAGGVFQRVPNSEVANTSADSIVIADTTTDAAIASQPTLYTESGAQPRQCPPGMPILISHADRFVGVDETRKNVWFTGQAVYGETPWWTSLFQFPVDVGGSITGLGSMDGRLYIAKRDRWFYVDGDGPVDSGASPYGLPQQIPGDVGCIEPRSVATTSLGMLFQADQGIYLLTRAHEFQFIGSGVEQSMIGATVTSAIVDEIHGRVYFTITTGGASAGKRLIFDYIHKVWTTGDLIEAGPSTLAVPVSAAIIGGAMHVLSATGQIFREDATTNLDGGAWVTATLETGWLKLDGLQGFTRTRDVTVLAEYVTDHDLTLSIGYNNADSYTDVRTFNRAAIAALTTPREQLGISCTRQKNESIRVKIVDVTPTGGTVGVGHGANFIGYAFTVAPKGSTYRLPAANQQ